MRLSEFQSKNIVNITDGKNIGNIIDVSVNLTTGNIESFIIEPNKSLLSIFGSRGKDTELKWSSIVKIGEDVILVKLS